MDKKATARLLKPFLILIVWLCAILLLVYVPELDLSDPIKPADLKPPSNPQHVINEATTQKFSLFLNHDGNQYPEIQVASLEVESRVGEFHHIMSNWRSVPKPGGVIQFESESRLHLSIAKLLGYYNRTSSYLSGVAYQSSSLRLGTSILKDHDTAKVLTLPPRFNHRSTKTNEEICLAVPESRLIIIPEIREEEFAIDSSIGDTVCIGWTDFYFLPRAIWLPIVRLSKLFESSDLPEQILMPTIIHLALAESGLSFSQMNNCIGSASVKSLPSVNNYETSAIECTQEYLI